MPSAESVNSRYVITPELVRHIAQLAALELDEAAEKRFIQELNHVLNYMKQLEKLNTEGIEATFQTFQNVNAMREDKIAPSLSPEAVLQNAPDREAGAFKVPPILGGES